MLILATRLRELSFRDLMAVYAEENLQSGRQHWPAEPEGRQPDLAEQAFYQYLRQVFFRTPGAYYAVWVENGQYVSALRMEPYRDGLLLNALETAPAHRGKGYATALVSAVLRQTQSKVYSHVEKQNRISIRTHETCGFYKVSDFAVYADGSVTRRSWTLRHDPAGTG